MKKGIVFLTGLFISLTASAKNFGSFDMSVQDAEQIKSLIVRELKKESVQRNVLLKNCFAPQEMEYLVQEVKADDLVILPATQSLTGLRDKQGNSIGEEIYSNVLVSGFGLHLGNKGQTYIQCLLNADVRIVRIENKPSHMSVEVNEAKLLGEIFSLYQAK